jgi:biopolymer transport protein ExbD
MSERRYRIIADINMTPLVDAMTLILIMFILAAPLLQSGIEVSLPRSRAQPVDVQEATVVTLTKAGAIYLDDREVPREQFVNVLQYRYELTHRKPVFVKADEEIPYGQVVELLGEIKQAGVSNLGLVAQAMR